MINLPTFDEWYQRKHGRTFEADYMQPSDSPSRLFKALVDNTKEYVSEMVKQMREDLK